MILLIFFKKYANRISGFVVLVKKSLNKDWETRSGVMQFREAEGGDYPLLTGSYESLKDPNNVLLTKEIAEKYFGDWQTAPGKRFVNFNK